ncbi:MAG: helicase, partial [Calditrichaeota bacterium]
ARELWDRGEIKRFAVLCPPYLCDQWEKELREKFNLEAVVFRSSTIGRLERQTPPGRTIYEQFPIQVISIDWAKSDRNRHLFLEFCPELVIVDEAHGAAEASSRNKAQQQRHRLLRDIAADASRHLILLTATPHSGIETAFRSLLQLLKPEFGDWDLSSLSETQRIELARHFVQRTRTDIKQLWESSHCFPEREAEDVSYSLSEDYRKLFDQTFQFCSELVSSGEALATPRRRVRYWGALALLRCVMSSPAAAVAALENRIKPLEEEQSDQEDFSYTVFEADQEATDDEVPIPPIEKTETTLEQAERRRLRRLADLAARLAGPEKDRKLVRCIEKIQQLLREGFHPIIWCRYVATAEYLGQELRRALSEEVQVVVITGRQGEEERRAMIDEIDAASPHVLVATDCLSEGINLQEKFNAVLHCDLPWNPNRLEQREGRVDRYGQTAPRVKAVRFYGKDNPVDGAVLEVLLNKAQEIHRSLGTHVPVPEESETVMEAIFNSLFLRHRRQPEQLSLFEENVQLQMFHRRWEEEARREKISRSRFAQRAIKPEEVAKALQEVDAVLGDARSVEDFVCNAAQRLNLPLRRDSRNPLVYLVPRDQNVLALLPEAIRQALPEPVTRSGTRETPPWRISFTSPTPEGAEYVGRNHRFVASLARYLLEEALAAGKKEDGHIPVVSRCGAVRTRAVQLLTTLLLLQVRYLVEIPGKAPMLAEEVLALGWQPQEGASDPLLPDGQALALLAGAEPSSNISPSEKRELVAFALEMLGDWERAGENWSGLTPLCRSIADKIHQRAAQLEASHKRIRRAVSLRVRELRVRPQMPPDLLAILVLQPEVRQ